MVSLDDSRVQERAAHRSERVLPVPVGDSSRLYSRSRIDSMTFDM